MSHVVTIDVKLTDKQAIKAACKNLSWQFKEQSTARFYDGSVMSGTVVHVPDWKYPVVITEDGTIKSDTYNDKWGRLEDLDRLKQGYSAEQTKATFAKQGLYASEQLNQDGSLTLTVQLHS